MIFAVTRQIEVHDLHEKGMRKSALYCITMSFVLRVAKTACNSLSRHLDS